MAKIKVNTTEEVVQHLPIKPNIELGNLCLVTLDSVETYVSKTDNRPTYEYNGIDIPKLMLTFKQVKLKNDEPDRLYKYIINPIVTIKNDGNAMKENTIISLTTSQYNHVKHIFDAFKDEPNFVALPKTITLPDYELDITNRIKDWEKFYNIFVTAFNKGKDDKAIFTNTRCFLKLIVNPGERKLEIPSYVNKGYIQKAKFDDKGNPITSLEFYADETVEIPKVVDVNDNSFQPTVNQDGLGGQKVDISKL